MEPDKCVLVRLGSDDLGYAVGEFVLAVEEVGPTEVVLTANAFRKNEWWSRKEAEMRHSRVLTEGEFLPRSGTPWGPTSGRRWQPSRGCLSGHSGSERPGPG